LRALGTADAGGPAGATASGPTASGPAEPGTAEPGTDAASPPDAIPDADVLPHADVLPPADVPHLCRLVGDIPGTDLARLLTALASDQANADRALRDLTDQAQAQALAADPPEHDPPEPIPTQDA
jgi:hypothetical protein